MPSRAGAGISPEGPSLLSRVSSSMGSPGSSGGAQQQQQARHESLTQDITGSVSWRRPDLVFRRNEVFLDLKETLFASLDSRGSILSSHAEARSRSHPRARLEMPACGMTAGRHVSVPSRARWR